MNSQQWQQDAVNYTRNATIMESNQRQKSRELVPKQIQIIEQNQRYSGINKMSKEIF